jgi:hypothetical protein
MLDNYNQYSQPPMTDPSQHATTLIKVSNQVAAEAAAVPAAFYTTTVRDNT